MKRISPGTVTVGVFAILFGLVAAYVVRHYLDGPAARSPTRQTAAVVTAKVNLPKYSRIREQALEVTQVPIKELPEGAVRNITVAVSPKQTNKPILAQRYGTLSVTLRSSLDEEMPAEAGGARDLVNPDDLLGLALQALPEKLEKKAQIWRGGTMQESTFPAERVRESLEATVASGAGEPAPAVRVGAASGNVPTLAPPQDMPHPAAEPRFDRQPRGQVIYVQVEAEGAGGEKN